MEVETLEQETLVKAFQGLVHNCDIVFLRHVSNVLLCF